MNDTKSSTVPGDNKSIAEERGASQEFSAPLGTLENGRLIFSSGAGSLRLKGEPGLNALFWAQFKGAIPGVWMQNGIVTIKYGRFPLLEQLVNWSRLSATMSINASIPWEIELRGGVSRLDADLSQLQLGSLDILGGASEIALKLSKSSGTTFIYLSGGISQGLFRVPAGTATRIQISGGASRLAFYGQRFGAIGGEIRLESPQFEHSTSRYDICIAGGASNLSIESTQ